MKYPEGGILSVDVAGPMIPAYDQGGYQARYFLVGVLTWRFPKSATMMDQPKDEGLEGDEPQIEANPEEEPREIEDQPSEAEEEEPEALACRDGLDQSPAQLPAEAEEQARAEEEKARRILKKQN